MECDKIGQNEALSSDSGLLEIAFLCLASPGDIGMFGLAILLRQHDDLLAVEIHALHCHNLPLIHVTSVLDSENFNPVTLRTE